MRVSATAKYLRHSTRKTRLVTRAIIGLPLEQASAMLRFMAQGAALDLAKLLVSAAASAENIHDLPHDGLAGAQATHREGPTIKRIRPRVQGLGSAIHRPM